MSQVTSRRLGRLLLRHGAEQIVVRPRAVSSKAQQQQQDAIQELVLNHRTLLAHLPSQKFNIAGVSFEGRQEPVSKLRKFQPLLLVPEPTNQYDPNAVAVHTLAGVPLGYVPKAHNQRFVSKGISPATVISVGQAQRPDAPDPTPLWGATVWSSPQATHLLPVPLPKAITTPGHDVHTRLTELLSASHPSATQQACELTGVAGSTVQLAPLWLLDFQQRRAWLQRLVAVAAPLARAMDLLRLAPGSTEFQEAELLVRQLNGWRPAEVEEYLTWAREQQARLEQEEWEVELKPLTEERVPDEKA